MTYDITPVTGAAWKQLRRRVFAFSPLLKSSEFSHGQKKKFYWFDIIPTILCPLLIPSQYFPRPDKVEDVLSRMITWNPLENKY